ncbi:transport system permease protein [Shewanella halifaxensis HAW-EB4]|uniref:Transport system permease protein n=1 Tax=Shewanella halifaxensis (strain HAW-EB4) TaxID=458817 RepID=B0TSJ6_SHEHH|nr:iron ABC transporter permease [Shewanella halifaxensis]ABZ77950.1 transport system permease protein [Shewanella halifaxensis HAW-EB4]
MDNRRWLWPSLLAALVITSLMSVSIGPLQISPSVSFHAVMNWATQLELGSVAPHEQLVINNVRLPRTILALTVGAILAQCGAVMQGLFRNPLADPGIIGVSSGAALGAAICIVLIPQGGEYMVALCAFFAGLVTTLTVYRLASSASGTSVVLLLLSGVAIAALAGAGIGLLTYMADDMALRDLTLWQMGSIAGAQWHYVVLTLLALALISWHFNRSAKALNALLLGEAEARHLGLDVDKLKLKLIVLCAIGVGVSVAATGIIGFIGLVVPHLVRMMVGPDHKQLLPLSAMLGAAILALADIGARSLVAPSELPVGLVTALLGAPFFILLLLKQRHRLV